MTIDRSVALERLDNDLELYGEICGIFLEDGPTMLDQLRASVAAGDVVTARRAAHSLKSASANIGATQLSTCSHQVEIACSTGDLSRALDLIPSLELLFAEVIGEISSENLL